MSLATVSTRSPFTSARTMVAPCSAITRPNSAPSRPAPPVMTATSPERPKRSFSPSRADIQSRLGHRLLGALVAHLGEMENVRRGDGVRFSFGRAGNEVLELADSTAGNDRDLRGFRYAPNQFRTISAATAPPAVPVQKTSTA